MRWQKKMGVLVKMRKDKELDQLATAAMQKIIDDGIVPGNALMIGQNGKKIYEKYLGYENIEKSRPISENTLYRMYSLTKVVTVVAALQLWEQNSFSMDDPLSKYIPEYLKMRVVEKSGELRSAAVDITVRHLLTMTSGLGYDDPAGRYRDFADSFHAARKNGISWDTVRVAREMAKLPLLFDPGTRFCYGFSYDVLGALVEIISGQTLATYCKNHIFAPLHMQDSGFSLDTKNHCCLAEGCCLENGKLMEYHGIDVPLVELMRFDNPKYLSGGAGLLSTLKDYFTFTQMLACGGSLNGVQILKESTVKMMHTPQLNTEQRNSYNDPAEDPCSFGKAYTYGYGVRVLTGTQPNCVASIGEWGWSGALGTWMAIDPTKNLFFVYAHQNMSPEHSSFVPDLMRAIYEGIE